MKYSFLAVALIFLFSCQSPKERAIKNISALEMGDSIFSNALVLQLKDQYIDFVKKYPDDEHSPEYLFKAAQRSIVLQQEKEALDLLEQLAKSYPTSPLCEDAMFLSAFTLENNLEDLEGAKVHYQDFLKKYPKGEFSADARLALENLGKEPMDEIQEDSLTN